MDHDHATADTAARGAPTVPFDTIDQEADTRIFGRDVGRDTSAVGMGVDPFGDPNLVDDFEQASAAIDAREFHDYAAEWTSSGVTFSSMVSRCGLWRRLAARAWRGR